MNYFYNNGYSYATSREFETEDKLF